MSGPDVLTSRELRTSVYAQTFDQLGVQHGVDIGKFWTDLPRPGRVDGVPRSLRARAMAAIIQGDPELQRWAGVMEVAEQKRVGGRMIGPIGIVLVLVGTFAAFRVLTNPLWHGVGLFWSMLPFLAVATPILFWIMIRKESRRRQAFVDWACAEGFHVPANYPAWARASWPKSWQVGERLVPATAPDALLARCRSHLPGARDPQPPAFRRS